MTIRIRLTTVRRVTAETSCEKIERQRGFRRDYFVKYVVIRLMGLQVEEVFKAK